MRMLKITEYDIINVEKVRSYHQVQARTYDDGYTTKKRLKIVFDNGDTFIYDYDQLTEDAKNALAFVVE